MRVPFNDLPLFSDHVLVDGAFNPLHSGHLAYLNAAASLLKGPLLCAVEDDERVRVRGKIPFLPGEQRAEIVGALRQVDHVHLKDRPTHEVLERLRPKAYVKGRDWHGQIPQEQRDVCARYEIPIIIVDSRSEDRSSACMRAWWQEQSDRDLALMERWIADHPPTLPERYDDEYFTGEWREYAYTLEERRIAEGARPDRIKDLWPDATILDVGCGPGCLVALLRERGLKAWGIDPSKVKPCVESVKPFIMRGCYAEDENGDYDVVISREVLEHLTIPELHDMVGHLFRVARKAVYITTRFHKAPSSPFSVIDQPEVDPTHQTLLTHQLLRALCVMNGGRQRADWERHLDFQGFGCTLAYEVSR